MSRTHQTAAILTFLSTLILGGLVLALIGAAMLGPLARAAHVPSLRTTVSALV